MKKKEQEIGFAEAHAYLKKRFPALSLWSMRNEVRNFPSRFGALRRNPVKRRGRGGRFVFLRSNLDKYQPFS